MTTNSYEAVSVIEARKKLGGISNAIFYKLVNSGDLRTFRIGRRRLISRSAIRDFVLDRESQNSSPCDSK